MKTPEEIKKGLECCSNVNFACNEECPYYKSLSEGEDCCLKKNADALAYIQQLETANAELLTKVEQLTAKCYQLERERDAAVECIGRLMVILKTYPYAATNGCAYQAYCEIQEYVENMRGVKEE